MFKRVICAGLVGCAVLIVWAFVVNGIFRFQVTIDMKKIPGERQVYEMLREQIVNPGRYICNPEPTPEGGSPAGEPVFSILYGGVGHEAAGRLMFFGFVLFLIAPLIGAWMLSQASERVLSSYPRKVLFFGAIGVLIAVFTDLASYGIGDYPLKDAILIAANHVVVWILVGLAAAPIIKLR
jgi:hypothetical protein